MIQLDLKSGIPIYDQLINGIIRLKMLGVLKGGDALPSVRSLAVKLGINPNTVQRAYSSLEEKGIVYSMPGKGTFLSDDEASREAVKQMHLEEFRCALQKAVSRGITKEELQKELESYFKEEDNL